MSNKSYRIRTKVNGEDNVLKVNLKQGVKTLNILSLEINPEDTYEKHTSDYGIIVGRVLANDAFGVPNVKVSVFVPLDSDDEDDYVISNEYPFKTTQSKDIDGKRYNLLTKKTGSAGTFPSKRMVLDNDGCIEVFEKYWKYTTTTNESGDYMIFGVPTGTCQMHYDCDLSDIGILSQHPYDFIAKGYDENLFKSKTEFDTSNLNTAIHIISRDITTYVYPFWGDKEENKIGITRNDINIDYKFEPSCVFMGSSITDPDGTYISTDGKPNGSNGSFASLATSVGDIEVIRKTEDGRVEELKDNVRGVIDANGVWCYQIPMNLDRIGTDEFGNTIAVNDPNKGIPTRARVRFRVSLSNNSSSGGITAKMLIPCNPELEYSSDNSTEPLPKGSRGLNGGGESTEIQENGGSSSGKRGSGVSLSGGRSGERGSGVSRNGVSRNNYAGVGPSTDDYNAPLDYVNIYEFGSNTPDVHFRDLYWGKVYSVKQYYPRFHYDDKPHSVMMYVGHENYFNKYSDYLFRAGSSWDSASSLMYDYSNFPVIFQYKQSCISSTEPISQTNAFPYTTLYAGPEVSIDYSVGYWFYYHFTEDSSDESLTNKGLHFCFENDWVNGCLYLPKFELQKNGEEYDYFGYKTDNNVDTTRSSYAVYDNIYISGRHNFYWDSNTSRFIARYVGDDKDCLYLTWNGDDVDTNTGRGAFGGDKTWIHQDRIYTFSRVKLYSGIITKKTTILGDDVFYYRCGCVQRGNGSRGNVGNVYRQLYSTDIILLGNLEDIYDHLPKLYNNLPVTTATFPPVGTNRDMTESGMSTHCYRSQIDYAEDKDWDMRDIFGVYCYKGSDFSWHMKPEIDSNDLSNTYYTNEFKKNLLDCVRESNTLYHYGDIYAMQALMRRVSLFFNLVIHHVYDFLSFDVPAFVNTSRLCELDVHNDMAFYSGDFAVPTNGMIDVYDISTNEKRSAFASMNYDINKYSIDLIGNRKFVATPIVISGFDGRFVDYISSGVMDFTLNGKKLANDDLDRSYMAFRFGYYDGWNGPFKQNEFYFSGGTEEKRYCLNYANGPLYLPQNSFYFYFGLRSGHSALDVLRDKYTGTSSDSDKGSQSTSILVTQNEYFSCDDTGQQLGSITVRTTNLSMPINWNVTQGAFSVKGGQTSNSEFDINDIIAGRNYKLEIVDSFNNSYSSNFYVDKEALSPEIQSKENPYINSHELIIETVNNKPIYGVSGTSVNIEDSYPSGCGVGGELCYYSGYSGNVLDVFQEDIDGISHYGTKIRFYFDKSFNYWYTEESESGYSRILHVIFDIDVEDLKITSKLMRRFCGEFDYREPCVTNETICHFEPYVNATLSLNNVPVEYINGWSPVSYWVASSNDVPDVVFDEPGTGNYNFNLFDSINVAHPDQTTTKWKDGGYIKSLNRGFDFSGSTITFKDQLGYVSSMCSSVFGNSAMILSDNGSAIGYLPNTISPDFSREEFKQIVNEWNSEGVFNSGSIQVASVSNRIPVGIPHIVGSNYPLSCDTKTILKFSVDNDDDIVVGYKNNENITAQNTQELADWWEGENQFGINMFGYSNKTNHELDKPLTLSPVFSANTNGTYPILNIENYFGLRSVDKRLDYRFLGSTPLLLPSGYNKFNNLRHKSIVDGKIDIDLYGGFRLNYTGSGETRELTSYRTMGEDFSRKFFGWNSEIRENWFNVVGKSHIEEELSGLTDSEKIEFIKDKSGLSYLLEFNEIPSGVKEKRWFENNCSKWLVSEYKSLADSEEHVLLWLKEMLQYTQNNGGGFNYLTIEEQKQYIRDNSIKTYTNPTKEDAIRYFLREKAWELYSENNNNDDYSDFGDCDSEQIEELKVRKTGGDMLWEDYTATSQEERESWLSGCGYYNVVRDVDSYVKSQFVYENSFYWAYLAFFEQYTDDDNKAYNLENSGYVTYQKNSSTPKMNLNDMLYSEWSGQTDSDRIEFVRNKHSHYIESMMYGLPAETFYKFVYEEWYYSFDEYFNNLNWISKIENNTYENIDKIINHLRDEYDNCPTYSEKMDFLTGNTFSDIDDITDIILEKQINTICSTAETRCWSATTEELNNYLDTTEHSVPLSDDDLEALYVAYSANGSTIDCAINSISDAVGDIISDIISYNKFTEDFQNAKTNWLEERNISTEDLKIENIELLKEFDDYCVDFQYNWIKKYGGEFLADYFKESFYGEQRALLIGLFQSASSCTYGVDSFFGWDEEERDSWIMENYAFSEIIDEFTEKNEGERLSWVEGNSKSWAIAIFNSKTTSERQEWIRENGGEYIASQYDSLSNEEKQTFIEENAGKWFNALFQSYTTSEKIQFVREDGGAVFVEQFNELSNGDKNNWLVDHIGQSKYNEFIGIKNYSKKLDWLNDDNNDDFRQIVSGKTGTDNLEGVFDNTTSNKHLMVWNWCRYWSVEKYNGYQDVSQKNEFVKNYYANIFEKEFFGYSKVEKEDWLREKSHEISLNEFKKWTKDDAKQYFIEINGGNWRVFEGLQTDSAREAYIRSLGRTTRERDALYAEFTLIESLQNNYKAYYVGKKTGELAEKEFSSITYEYARRQWFIDVVGETTAKVINTNQIDRWISDNGGNPDYIQNKTQWIKVVAGEDAYNEYVGTVKDVDKQNMLISAATEWRDNVFSDYISDDRYLWVYRNITAPTLSDKTSFAQEFSATTLDWQNTSGDVINTVVIGVEPEITSGMTWASFIVAIQTQKFNQLTTEKAKEYWVDWKFSGQYGSIYTASEAKKTMSDNSIREFKKAITNDDYADDNAKAFVSQTLVETYGGNWGEFSEYTPNEKNNWLTNAGVYEIYTQINRTDNPISAEGLLELYVYIISGEWGVEYYDTLNDKGKYAYIYENSGGDLIGGGPQRFETVQGKGDEAKLFDVSFTEDDALVEKKVIDENKINVWDMVFDYINLYDEVIPSYIMPSDIDHVKYSIGCLSGGSSNFTGSFIDCNTSFGGGLVIPGNREDLSISYEPGVKIIEHVDLEDAYDVLYNVSSIAISATPSSRTEVFASLESSSLSFTLTGDSVWPGETYTDAFYNGKHESGYFPSWVDMSTYDDGVWPHQYELHACVCQPGRINGVNKINFVREIGLQMNGSAGYYYDPNKYVCIYKEEDGVEKPVDDKNLSNITFNLSDGELLNQENYELPGDSFIMIPTTKVYTTLSNNTQLKQGVIYNRGYTYYTGSLYCSISESKNHVGVLINTPLRVRDTIIVNYNVNKLFTSDAWHTVGKVDENSIICDNDNVTVTYNENYMKFDIIRNDESVESASVYFSIENGLRYKMLISFE